MDDVDCVVDPPHTSSRAGLWMMWVVWLMHHISTRRIMDDVDGVVDPHISTRRIVDDVDRVLDPHISTRRIAIVDDVDCVVDPPHLYAADCG